MKNESEGVRIARLLRDAKTQLGDHYPKKFGGAAAVLILKNELEKNGILSSEPNVYIEGCKSEIDLIIPRDQKNKNRKIINPWEMILYKPSDIALALEVKKSGSYGKEGLKKIKDLYESLLCICVDMAYLTFEDTKSYIHRPTKGKVRAECYCLAWHKSYGSDPTPTEEDINWEAFLKYVKSKTKV